MRRLVLPIHIDERTPAPGSRLFSLGGLTMGTSWSARLYAAPSCDAAALQRALEDRLVGLMAQMSHWDAQSELGRFNRAPAGSWQTVSADFLEVLTQAQQVARLSGGAFDPCAGALVNLWGFGPAARLGRADVPSPAAIDEARAQGGWQALDIDFEGRRVRQPGRLQLDLSGIAKGFAVDCLGAVLARYGVHHYLVEVGGELRGAGAKADGLPWWVALEQIEPAPGNSAAAPGQMVVAMHGLAVATSGDYRRFFEIDGRRYAHTIDPRSGWPIANGVALATVIGPDCMLADAWATALSVLGPQEGVQLADAHGIAARLVLRDEAQTEILSAALRALLQ